MPATEKMQEILILLQWDPLRKKRDPLEKKSIELGKKGISRTFLIRMTNTIFNARSLQRSSTLSWIN